MKIFINKKGKIVGCSNKGNCPTMKTVEIDNFDIELFGRAFVKSEKIKGKITKKDLIIYEPLKLKLPKIIKLNVPFYATVYLPKNSPDDEITFIGSYLNDKSEPKSSNQKVIKNKAKQLFTFTKPGEYFIKSYSEHHGSTSIRIQVNDDVREI